MYIFNLRRVLAHYEFSENSLTTSSDTINRQQQCYKPWNSTVFNWNFWLCTRLVSRICHEGAVANVDFKLCRSSLDGHRVRRKVETSSSEAKLVRIGAGSFKIFTSRPEKGTDGLSFFALEGKIEQRIRISARKRTLSPGLSKQHCPALISSIESYDKHLKTP